MNMKRRHSKFGLERYIDLPSGAMVWIRLSGRHHRMVTYRDVNGENRTTYRAKEWDLRARGARQGAQ